MEVILLLVYVRGNPLRLQDQVEPVNIDSIEPVQCVGKIPRYLRGVCECYKDK